MAKRVVKLTCEVTVPFETYAKEKLNKRAASQIEKWVRDTLRNEVSHIPLYVEMDDYGSSIEDCSGKAKIVVRSERAD
jgi:hypothetical protein